VFDVVQIKVQLILDQAQEAGGGPPLRGSPPPWALWSKSFLLGNLDLDHQ
jgi:hypothetical protein